jgi:dethiobiotin synthetase
MPEIVGGAARPDRVLVTGTDTGVGKTWVACALARALRETGHRVVALKPVETGCDTEPSEREDGVQLARAAGQAEPAHAIIRLAPPLAPALALEQTGAEIDFDALILRMERYARTGNFFLFEGAGGLLSPITWEWNVTDVAQTLNARALVVGLDRLGVINHTLLTLSALELAGIPVLGVVLTTPDVVDESTGTNAGAIARLSGIDRVTMAPRTADPVAGAHALAPVLTWLGPIGATKSS